MNDIDAALFGVDSVPGIQVRGRTFVLGRDCVFGAAEGVAWKAVRRAPRLSSAVRAFRPDLVIAHHLPNAWRVARLVERCGVPLAAFCHGSDLLAMHGSLRPRSRALRQLAANWPRLVEAVELFLPVSQFLGRRLAENGVPTSRIAVHYLGVPIPESADLGSAAERSGVLFVGRLVDNKGCDFLLRAVGEIARERRIEVTVVGDGPQRQALQHLAATLPAGATVRFLGSQPHDSVYRLMREHRVLCVPSVEARSGASEGLGLVACEAAAHARPVVVYDTGGLQETVVHGETGLVVPQRDVPELARALGSVLVDDSMATDMGRAARLFAEEKFNLSTQARRLRGLLAERGLLAPQCEPERRLG
ncbi:glycosyltransferase [Streptomyces sp. NPDC003758]